MEADRCRGVGPSGGIVDLLASDGFDTAFLEDNLIYNTYSVAVVDGEVVGFARFEIKGQAALITQCVIKKPFRGRGVLKILIDEGRRKFPYLKEIGWERERKNRPLKTFDLEKVNRRTTWEAQK